MSILIALATFIGFGVLTLLALLLIISCFLYILPNNGLYEFTMGEEDKDKE